MESVINSSFHPVRNYDMWYFIYYIYIGGGGGFIVWHLQYSKVFLCVCVVLITCRYIFFISTLCDMCPLERNHISGVHCLADVYCAVGVKYTKKKKILIFRVSKSKISEWKYNHFSRNKTCIILSIKIYCEYIAKKTIFPLLLAYPINQQQQHCLSKIALGYLLYIGTFAAVKVIVIKRGGGVPLFRCVVRYATAFYTHKYFLTLIVVIFVCPRKFSIYYVHNIFY